MVTKSRFFKLIAISALISAALFFGTSLFVSIKNYVDLLVMSIVFFTVLSGLTYWLGQIALKGNRGAAFINIVIMNVFTKLIGSFIFVFTYVKIKEPNDRTFLIPFIITYLVFLVSETYLLNIQARQSKSR